MTFNKIYDDYDYQEYNSPKSLFGTFFSFFSNIFSPDKNDESSVGLIQYKEPQVQSVSPNEHNKNKSGNALHQYNEPTVLNFFEKIR
jgi:hypothetical protein